MFEPSSIEKIKTKKIYSLEGNIGAGKTTILRILEKNFKDVEFVEEPVKEWRMLQDVETMSLAKEKWFVESFATQLDIS